MPRAAACVVSAAVVLAAAGCKRAEGPSCAAPPVVSVRRPALPGTGAGLASLVAALGAPGADVPALVRSLRPDSEDYAAVFDAGLARRMERWAAPRWEKGWVNIGPSRPGLDFFVHSLTPERLQHPGSELCGRAYAKSGVEKHVLPQVTIWCYGFRAQDQGETDRAVALVDALVFVRGHWALFPRPAEVPADPPPACPARVTTDPDPLPLPAPARARPEPGGYADARAVLQRMLDDRGSLRAQLLALEPGLEDYRAVYTEPAATRLAKAMKPRWDAARAGAPLLSASDEILPEIGDDTVHLVSAAAPQVKAGVHGCPSGYAEVAQSLRDDAVVHCFSFSPVGLGEGVMMDGLVYARGRWVLIPRPWAALTDK